VPAVPPPDAPMSIERRIRRLPPVRRYLRTRRFARVQRETGALVVDPPGNFSSPIPALNEVRAREHEIFARPETVPGIELRVAEQLALAKELAPFAEDQPFGEHAREGLRYRFDNPYFRWPDALVLHCLLRWARPKRLVEIGSGFSSAVILDTNDLFLDGTLSCTFVEPHPSRLEQLLQRDDARRHKVIERPVQSVDLELFDALGSNDVLFVDSSHVAKVGSDVNRIMFDVLPRLRPGVLVHFHDIGWPFEYPREWIFQGRAWNEAYLVRAFLDFNNAFEIMFFNHYLSLFHQAEVAAAMPLWGREAGGSLWVRRSDTAHT
jgi:predicted O-methyltransferase YrrM